MLQIQSLGLFFVILTHNLYRIHKNVNKTQFLKVFYLIPFNAAYRLWLTHIKLLQTTQVFQIRVYIMYTICYILISFQWLYAEWLWGIPLINI
jgi:hypothetical protein